MLEGVDEKRALALRLRGLLMHSSTTTQTGSTRETCCSLQPCGSDGSPRSSVRRTLATHLMKVVEAEIYVLDDVTRCDECAVDTHGKSHTKRRAEHDTRYGLRFVRKLSCAPSFIAKIPWPPVRLSKGTFFGIESTTAKSWFPQKSSIGAGENGRAILHYSRTAVSVGVELELDYCPSEFHSSLRNE